MWIRCFVSTHIISATLTRLIISLHGADEIGMVLMRLWLSADDIVALWHSADEVVA